MMYGPSDGQWRFMMVMMWIGIVVMAIAIFAAPFLVLELVWHLHVGLR